MKQKACSRCGIEKPLSEFHSTGYSYSKSGRVKVHKSDCKDCANKKWRARREEMFSRLVKEWKCSVCGYARCERALEFHHVEQHEKDFLISAQYTIAFERLKKELEKCVLVCANCHREIHDGLIKLE